MIDKSKVIQLMAIVLLAFGNATLFGQTGPAGIGNATGTNGHPHNLGWLDATDLSGFVTGDSWLDKSGNDHHAVSDGANISLGNINGVSALDFSAFTSGNFAIAHHADFDDVDELSIFVVYNSGPNDNPQGLVSKRVSTGNISFSLFQYSNFRLYADYISSSNRINGANNTSETNYIGNYIFQTNDSLKIYKNGILDNSAWRLTGAANTNNTTVDIEIGKLDASYSDGNNFKGKIAEIIIYKTNLTPIQRAIVVSYLSTKYGIGVQEVNLAYSATEGTYYEDLTGYARSSTGFKNFGPSDGLYISLNDADIGDYITAAHNGALNDIENIQTGADVTASGAVGAWNRDWYVEKGGLSTAKISFSFPEGFDEGSFPQELSNYVLLRKNSPEGTYSQVNLADKGVELGERVWFEVADAVFEDGYYTLGTLDQSASPLEGGSTRTWYSLISGDWDNWEVWTLDPSGALPNNPNQYTPSTSPTAASDKVVVLNGKTVTVSTNDKIHQQVTVDGRLDLQGTSGHDFGQIRGRGRILLNADHFPAGDANHFSSAGQGEGTVVYYGDGFELTQNLKFFNLEVDLVSASDRITLLNDLTINGEFRVKNGEFQFNDDVATNDLKVTVHGNVVVEANGKLQTGMANARHQFNLYGDFTNNGNVAFTNRLTAIYNSEAADGIVDVNFLNGSKNQLAFFNGPSKMYRIEIDKGTDATYELAIEATNADYFKLFGYANSSHSSAAQLTDNTNALGLIRGSVRVKSNINIPMLNNTGNYNISESARLWVDGGSVAKTSGTAIVPYGVIQVSAGTLSALVNSGITTRGNGLVKVDGGTLNMNQLRTSVLGTENVGGYVQSGGTTNVMGGSTSNDYYCFNLTYPGNVFNMSGGTLHIHEANSKGGVFIASSETNYNVTGGAVIMEIGNSDDFPITSIAPFWNVILRNSSGGAGQHILSGGTDVGSSNENLSAQALVVLNDLTIEADAFLNHDGNDVIIGRDFSINADAQSVTFDNSGMNDTWNSYNIGYLFDPAKPNTTIFNGSEDGEFYIGYNNSDGFEEFFHNITVNKAKGSSITFVCDLRKTAQYQDDNNRGHWFARLPRIENELRVESGILDQGQSAFRLFGPLTVLEDGECGVWEQGITHPWAWFMLKDADSEITTEEGAVIGNIKMNPNPTTAIITFTSDVYIKRIGYFHGRINLQSYELKLDYLIDELTTNNYDISDGNSSQEMFYSAGKASDGGLSLYVPAGTADGTIFPFPLGVLGKYTPAEIELSNVTDDGYVNIRPVDGELQTTNLSGGDLLNYYWRVKYDGFDAAPTVNQLRLKYHDADIVGSEASYAAGKVLDVHPFTRSYEDDPNPEGVNPSNNTITFNGAGNTGFTLEEAFYTAGETGRFTGSPEIFYLRVNNGDWNNGNTWSYSRGGGAAGDYPKAGDIAILRRRSATYSGIVTVRQPETAAAVIFDDENGFASGCPRIIFDTQNSYASYGSNFEIVDVADTHQGGTLNYNTHGAVIQYNIEDNYSNASTSLEFDGNDDYVAIQNFNYNSAGLTAFTVETWIKTNDAGDQIIASFDRNEFWRLEVNGNGAGNGQIGFDIMTDAGQLDFGGSTRIDDGNWHHVAGVFDNGNVYLYIDGNLDNSTTRGSTFGSAGVTRYGFVGVGSEADSYNGGRGPNNYFNGHISDFRVWSVARSQAQIQASMNSGLAGSETGLEIYYKLDGSGSENTLTDVTSSGNTGDLMNFSLPGAWTTYHPWGSSFPNGDFGGFNSYPNALVIYGWDGATANADVTLSASATEYPQMWFSGGNGSRIIRFPDTDVTIHGGFTIPAQSIVVANGDSDNTITMMQNFTIGSPSLGYGEFLFPGNSTNPVTLDVKKNINVRGSANSFLGLENASGGISIHKLIVGGDVTVDASGGQIQLGDGDPAKSNVELEFQGNENASFINNYGSSTPQFYRLIMNKGVDPSATYTLNSDFSLTGATSGVDVNKAIELQNGKLVLNNSTINLNLTSGDDDFFIPQTAALEVRQGQVRASGNSGVLLDGQLIVSGGTVDMSGGNNYIQYSVSGNAAIDVSDGSLIVGSQIRRGLTSSEGILDYTQTGGTVIVGNDVAPENSRGVFEVLNTGSNFSFTGGELHIARAQNNPTLAAVYLAPETVTTDNLAVLKIGHINTPAGQTIGLYSNVEIPNLVIDNSGGHGPVLRQWTVALTVSNLLEVDAGAGFDADGNDLILKGDFLCAGDFIPNGNTTIFSGAGDQEMIGDLTFFNLTKSSPGELRLNNSIIVQNRLRHEDGLLVDNSHVVSVGGSLYMYGGHEWGGSGRGIVLNGIEQQMLYGSGAFGKLTTNNPEGIKVDDGNTVYINRALQMEQGVLNVGSNLLVLADEALIIEENPFSAFNMIQTNVSFTDNGVKKFLPSGAGNFTFPVGSAGRYTPVKLSITTNNNGTGSLLVKPAGEAHPSVSVENLNYVLNYHWVVRAEGLSGFSAEARMKYDIGDVKGNIEEYITARLLTGLAGEWNKFSGEEVIDEANRELVFSFFSTDDVGISGDYTAGLDAAIPDKVPTYITIGNGLWNNAAIWDTYPDAGGSVPESGPRGSMVVVDHAVDMPGNYTSSYRTTIAENGVLSIGSTFGHRLGEVFGSGVLSLESGDMPAGFYEDFLKESGGTLRFGGSGDYDILSGINQLNNLELTGSGTRRFPNSNVQLMGSLLINGPQARNEQNRTIYVKGDVVFESGAFVAGNGETSVFVLNGSASQTLSGSAGFSGSHSFNRLTINNPAGVVFTLDADVKDVLNLSAGRVIVDESAIFRVDNYSAAAISGASATRYIDGPLYKRINSGASFDFPLGNEGRYGNIKLDNVSVEGMWRAQYHSSSPSGAGLSTGSKEDPVQYVSSSEYWNIEAPAVATAEVTLRWDASSGVNPVETGLRGVQWLTDKWHEVTLSNVSGTSSAGTARIPSLSFNANAGGNYITFGAITIPAYRWTGATGTDWFTAGNWSNSTVPSASAHTTIEAVSNLPMITGANVAQVNNLIIEAGADLTVASNGKLTVNGDLTMAATSELILDNAYGVNGMASLITHGQILGDGSTRIRLTTPPNQWFYLGSSVKDAIFSDFSAGADNIIINVYRVNQWWGIKSGLAHRSLRFMEGIVTNLLLEGSTDNRLIEYTGVLHTAAVSRIYDESGYHLLANPYPSFISWEDAAGWERPNVSGTIWYRGKIGAEMAFITYNRDALPNAKVALYPDTEVTFTTEEELSLIPPMQAVWVSTSVPGVTVTVKPEACRHGIAGSMLKSSSTSRYGDVIRIETENAFSRDGAVLYFSNGSEEGLDKGDSEKYFNDSENIPEVYTRVGDKALSINGLPLLNEAARTIPLSVRNRIAGEVTMTFDLGYYYGQHAPYLEDRETGAFINLLHENSYTYTVSETGDNHDRFVLNFYLVSTDLETPGADETDAGSSINIKSLSGKVLVSVGIDLLQDGNGTVEIYTIEGRKISEVPARSSRTLILLPDESGVYIIRAKFGNQVKSERVIGGR